MPDVTVPIDSLSAGTGEPAGRRGKRRAPSRAGAPETRRPTRRREGGVADDSWGRMVALPGKAGDVGARRDLPGVRETRGEGKAVRDWRGARVRAGEQQDKGRGRTDDPREAGLDRRDALVEVVAVQAHASLEP